MQKYGRGQKFTFYGYDQNDKSIGKPKNVDFKVGMKGTHGNSISYSRGFRIHPKDITITSGCLGIQGYRDSVSFLSFIHSHSGIELFVGSNLPCCQKNNTIP